VRPDRVIFPTPILCQHPRFQSGNSGIENLQFAGSVSIVKNDALSSIYYSKFDDPANNNGIVCNLDGESAERGYMTSSYKNLRLTVNSSSRKKSIPTGSYGSILNIDN